MFHRPNSQLEIDVDANSIVLSPRVVLVEPRSKCGTIADCAY